MAECKSTDEERPGNGNRLFALDASCYNAVVLPLTFDLRVNELIMDNGRVIGVRAFDDKGKTVTAKARKAVVMTTGSFMREGSMVAKYMPDLIYTTAGSSPGAAGDGRKMVRSIGGDWRDMDLGVRWATVDAGVYSQTVMGSWAYCGVSLPQVPGIFINTQGKRYAPETLGYSFSAFEIFKQPDHMAYYLVDSVRAKNTHLFGSNEVSTARNESSSGLMLYQADTFEELAAKMNVDPSTLVAEVDRYNGFVAAGTDADFNKVMDGTTAISTGPFYALLEMPAPYNIYGGIRTDEDSHVLDTSGDPVPGLYAAGSCCGSYAEQEGLYYTGGVVQAMTFGWQAGQHAAAEDAQE